MQPYTLCVDDSPVLLVTGQPDPFKPAVDLDELRAIGVPGWDGDPDRLSARTPTVQEARRLINALEDAWCGGTRPYGVMGGFQLRLVDDGIAVPPG